MEVATDRLVIFKGSECWMARFLGAHRASVVEAFGTDVVPTPYPPSLDGERVRAELAKLNPTVEVRLVALAPRGWSHVEGIGRDVLSDVPCARCGSRRHVGCGGVEVEVTR